jgi:lipopolysaccharide biosynthesis glycosyltransferase
MKKQLKEIPEATPEEKILSLLYRPTAGFEIPDDLRQTLLFMVVHGKVKEAGLHTTRYDLSIFWLTKGDA